MIADSPTTPPAPVLASRGGPADVPQRHAVRRGALPEGDRDHREGWRRLVSEIGVEFMHDEALELFREAGQRVEGEVVHFDPDWVLEQVAHAPSEFHLRARDPQHDVTIGGRTMVFASVSGPPFFRIGDERRDGHAGRLRADGQAGALLPRARPGHDADDRARRRAAGLPSPRHVAHRDEVHLQAGASDPRCSTANAEDSIEFAGSSMPARSSSCRAAPPTRVRPPR